MAAQVRMAGFEELYDRIARFYDPEEDRRQQVGLLVIPQPARIGAGLECVLTVRPQALTSRKQTAETGIPMTNKQAGLGERLKQLGFKPENQMELYGEEFELLGEPIVVRDDLVFVDAIEKKSGQRRRVRIPLTILNAANGGPRPA